jgi:hypothetical protein
VPIIHPRILPPENVSERTTVYFGHGRVESITKPANDILGELIRGKLEVTGIMRKMYFPVDDETDLLIASAYVYVRPTRVYKNQADPPGQYRYYPDVVPREDFDVHFLMLKRMEYQIEQRPARCPQKTYEGEFEEQGLVVIPYADESGGWIRIGSFSIIHQVNWPDEIENLAFSGLCDGMKEDECEIRLY